MEYGILINIKSHAGKILSIPLQVLFYVLSAAYKIHLYLYYCLQKYNIQNVACFLSCIDKM